MRPVIPGDARMEIKFVAREVHRPRLVNWLAMHPAGFKSPYPDRKVNNVYFDTHGYYAHAQNLSGASARVKLRYRWYGESCEPAAGVLEVKCKRNYFGWKLRFKCPDVEMGPQDDWRQFQRSLSADIPLDGRIWLNTYPFPVMINRYFRQYFVSADEKVRVTIDTGQAVWDQRLKARPNYTLAANLPKSMVVEVKFDRHDRDLASSIIQGIPIRVSRHSKYITGMNAINGR